MRTAEGGGGGQQKEKEGEDKREEDSRGRRVRAAEEEGEILRITEDAFLWYQRTVTGLSISVTFLTQTCSAPFPMLPPLC